MTNKPFRITRGDTLPILRFKPRVAIPPDSQVVFNMPPVISRAPAQIVDGELQYEWQDGDTDVAGVYFAEFEVTFANSKRLTLYRMSGDRRLMVTIAADQG